MLLVSSIVFFGGEIIFHQKGVDAGFNLLLTHRLNKGSLQESQTRRKEETINFFKTLISFHHNNGALLIADTSTSSQSNVSGFSSDGTARSSTS